MDDTSRVVPSDRSMGMRSRVESTRPSAERDGIRKVVVARVTQFAPDVPGALRSEPVAARSRRPGPGADLLDVSAADIAIPRVIRNHRRFALSDVTFDGDPVGGATIDAWQNDVGAVCWSARVLMVGTDVRAGGALAGRTRDGRLLHGRVARGATGPAPRPRGAALVEWHGIDALRADPPAEDV